MPMSNYIREVRELVGTRVLCLPAVTALIQDDDNRVMMIQDMGSDHWVLPGGMMEPGEQPATTVVREMREELGVRIVPVSLIAVFGGPEFFITYPNGDQVSYVTSVFLCKIVEGIAQADNLEVQRAEFMTLPQIDKLGVKPWVKRVLACVGNAPVGARFEGAVVD